jgi:signal recognition particle receptor subunit beta
MASINYAFKEIISKIVYYGPGLSGKTTNLQYVYKKVPDKTRGELISLATDADRTLYFDFLPVNVGTIQGFATKFQLYTVPGQVYYNATRKLVLRGVDGIVFVADSQVEKMDENTESLQNLQDNLDEYGYDRSQIPMVIQYNKRDLSNVADIAELERILNPGGLMHFEAVAVTGEGVFRTLKAISKLVLEQIRKSSHGAPKVAQPVAAGVASDKPEAVSQPVVQSEPAPVSAEPETPPKAEATIEKEPKKAKEKQPEAVKESEPEIMKDPNTHANVVVSDYTDYDDPVAEKKDDVEETTERSVLKDDSDEVDEEVPPGKQHPDVLDDYQEESEPPSRPLYGGDDGKASFDDEATQISDLTLKDPLTLNKPQMAESRKVKDKRSLFNLFGAFKKKKK